MSETKTVPVEPTEEMIEAGKLAYWRSFTSKISVLALNIYKAMLAEAPNTAPEGDGIAYQRNVHRWMLDCFGKDIASDKQERNHRFLEESLELVQAIGCTRSEALQLVNYVFDRPVGEIAQEIGGVMVTLAALCNANNKGFMTCGAAELNRVWTKVETIRAKQAAKPKHSPLPEAAPATNSAQISSTLVDGPEVLVKDDGVWLLFRSPTGKQALINTDSIASWNTSIIKKAVNEWAQAIHTKHFPKEQIGHE